MKEQAAANPNQPASEPFPAFKSINNNNKKKERILVVDQDDGTLSLLSQIIKLTGYEAEFTRTINEALAALERAAFDLLIADYHLPDAQALWQTLQKRQPQIRAIYLVRHRQMLLEAVHHPQATFIPKPFAFDDIVRKIHELVHQKNLQQLEEQFQRLRRQLFHF